MTDQYLNVALNIANRLSSEALWHESQCNWVGYKYEQNQLISQNLNTSIYDGTAGINLFFLKLQEHIDNAIHNKTRKGSLEHVVNSLNEGNSNKRDTFSFYSGDLGKIFCLIRNAVIDDNESLGLKSIEYLDQRLETISFDNPNFDLINSFGGILNPVLHLYDLIEEDSILVAANSILDQYLELVQSKGFKSQNIGVGSGFHGVFSALLKTAIQLDNPDALSTLLSIATREIQSTQKYWYQWRQVGYMDNLLMTHDPNALGWLTGWTSVIHSRLTLSAIDERFETEAIEALDFLTEIVYQVINSNHGSSNFSKVNGLAGMGMVMLEGYEIFQHERYLNCAMHIGNQGYYNHYQTNLEWPSGIQPPYGQEDIPSYGLMEGISGTGMFYLNLVDVINAKDL